MIKRVDGIEIGSCYHNALLTIFENQDWTLVHGICVLQGGPYEGNLFGHAWLEKDMNGLRLVYDPTHDAIVFAAIYYRAGEVGYTHRYSFDEARDLAVETGHSGCWDEKINTVMHGDTHEKNLKRAKRSNVGTLRKKAKVLDTFADR